MLANFRTLFFPQRAYIEYPELIAIFAFIGKNI
jgi:hypothetical protein